MLLVHRQVVIGDRHWFRNSQLLVGLETHGIDFKHHPAALFLIYQIILNIFDPGTLANNGLSIDWLLTHDPDTVLDLGLSRRVLFYLGYITQLAKQKPPDSLPAHTVPPRLGLLSDVRQNTSGVDGEASAVVGSIALSYKVSAILLMYCRIFG
jgi:hypothetical protein